MSVYPMSSNMMMGVGSSSVVPFVKNFYEEHPSISQMSVEEMEAIRMEHNIVCYDRNTPKPVRTFEEASFPDYLIGALYNAGFQKPTSIQLQGWPIALSGHDMIGIAETGSGKTCAFLLPGIVHILAQPEMRRGDGPIMLVLAPTRELAMQIQTQCDKFGRPSKIQSCCIYGGEPKRNQIHSLSHSPEIVVATPGRLLDMLEGNYTNLRRVTYLVLDEADRMLDMGFEEQMRKIVSQIRPDRQTLMWSATWPREVERLARDFCKENPIKISVGSLELRANKSIKQHIILIDSHAKAEKLKLTEDLLDRFGRESTNTQTNIPLKTIIFCERKTDCDHLTRDLRMKQFPAQSIHGDKSQFERERIIANFKNDRCPILIATDVAARGLDVKDVGFVINFDMPKDITSYVHRIGRTGRAGEKGESYTFINKDDFSNGKAIRELIDILTEANQQVPDELYNIAAPPKRQYHNRDNNHHGHYNKYNNNNNRDYNNRDYNNRDYNNRDYNGGGGGSGGSRYNRSYNDNEKRYNNDRSVDRSSRYTHHPVANNNYNYSTSSTVATYNPYPQPLSSTSTTHTTPYYQSYNNHINNSTPTTSASYHQQNNQMMVINAAATAGHNNNIPAGNNNTYYNNNNHGAAA